jgi:hypothetical protein
MTFICCWEHLEAAVVTEAAAIKAEIQRVKIEVLDATIHVQPHTASKCQVCGKNSLFSVYYYCKYREDTKAKPT